MHGIQRAMDGAGLSRGLASAAMLLILVAGSHPRVAGAAQPPGSSKIPQADSTGWPHLRGPRYNAVSKERGLADRWPDTGPPVLWTRELGQGYSSFIVVGNRAYTQTQNLYGQYVVCLDAATGRDIWKHRYGLPYETTGIYPGPRSTPTFASGRIFFAAPDGSIGCLNADDGTPVWTVNPQQKFRGRGTDFGYSASPLVIEGRVILPVGGRGACVVALDAHTGETVWRAGDEPASYCSVIPITFQGRRHVVAFLQNALAAFDFESGRLLWEHVYSQGYDEHSAFPLYAEPHLFIACPFRGGSTVYRIEGTDPSGIAAPVQAVQVRSSTIMSNDVASSVLVDGKVYGFDLRDVQSKAHRPSRGEFRCLDLITGDVHWSTDQVGQSSIIVADEKLILFTDAGELILARATPESYQELSRTQVFRGEICWSAPALVQGRLFLRTHTRAACIDLGVASSREAKRPPGALTTTDLAEYQPLDLTWLVGGEREHPFVHLATDELLWWYVFAFVGVMGSAAVIAALVAAPLYAVRPAAARFGGRAAFWGVSFLFALTAGPAFNQCWNWLRGERIVRSPHEFIFVWPAALFVAFAAVSMAITWAEQHEHRRKARWGSRLAGLAFFAVGAAYFVLCRRLSMMHEWVFLAGFLPAAPFTVLLARRTIQRPSLAWEIVWTTAGFAAFFWGAAVISMAKLAWFAAGE